MLKKEKLAITTRHRILATILQRISAPLKKCDLVAVAHYLIGHLSYSQAPILAKRHKVKTKKDSASAQELLAKQVGTYDESELCQLLLEISFAVGRNCGIGSSSLNADVNAFDMFDTRTSRRLYRGDGDRHY